MKKYEFSKLALMGVASGLMALGQGLEAGDSSSLDVHNLLAKPACKGLGGCGGITADRETPQHADEDEVDTDDDSDDASEADEEKDDAAKKKNDATLDKK